MVAPKGIYGKNFLRGKADDGIAGNVIRLAVKLWRAMRNLIPYRKGQVTLSRVGGKESWRQKRTQPDGPLHAAVSHQQAQFAFDAEE